MKVGDRVRVVKHNLAVDDWEFFDQYIGEEGTVEHVWETPIDDVPIDVYFENRRVAVSFSPTELEVI